jgi:two-component system, chemotaxis family, chemotaxis protein CheY
MTQCLIVDGSQSGRTDIESLLAHYGFELDSVEDTEEALERCRSRMPDVLLISRRLGTPDPISFLKRLGKRRRLPVVFIYGDEQDPETIGRAIWEGASAFLMRPFDAEILDLKLRQAGVI